MTGDLRCYMGAPLSDQHRCHGQVDSWFDLWCPTCKAAIETGTRCGCAGCRLLYGPDDQ